MRVPLQLSVQFVAEPVTFQFGLGLCFYPEFGVSVRSSEKGPGRTLVRSSGSEFGERIWPNPGLAGSEFGERNGTNPGSAGSGFGVLRKDRAEPWFSVRVQSSEKGSGLTRVRQVRRKEKGMGRTLIWQVRRKSLAEP